jgi:hypothetical protein
MSGTIYKSFAKFGFIFTVPHSFFLPPCVPSLSFVHSSILPLFLASYLPYSPHSGRIFFKKVKIPLFRGLSKKAQIL